MIPLVLVHGFMGGSAQWHLQRSIGDTCAMICVDLPGFGARNGEPVIASIRGFANSVIADLNALGINRFHLLGHSMGGMIAQEIIHQVPDRVERLILFGTGAVGLLPGRFETIAQSKARAVQDGVGPTARRIAATWFLEREAAAQYEACAAIAERTSAAAFGAGLDAMAGWSGENRLRDIRAKTLVLWGAQDRTYPRDQTDLLARTIPDAQLVVVDGCAHAAHMEMPDVINHHLKAFVRA